MSKGHAKAGTAGAFGHDGNSEAKYNVRGRNVGGRLHRAGAKKWKPEEVSLIVSKAVVVHKTEAEIKLTARVTATLSSLNERLAVAAAKRATRQLAQLAAIRYTPFVSAAESARDRLVAAGVIS